MNEASQWRFTLAQQIGKSYAANPKARVVMVAGSTGRGTADRYSDLEIDVYWSAPPTDAERRTAAEGSGGVLVALSDYEDDEWEEDISFGGFHASTSTFLVETMERYLTGVLDHYSTAPLPQMRLYSLQHAIPLVGTDLVDRWRARAANYPTPLAHAMLRENLVFEGFGVYPDLRLIGTATRLLTIPRAWYSRRAVLAGKDVRLPDADKGCYFFLTRLATSRTKAAGTLMPIPSSISKSNSCCPIIDLNSPL